MRLMCKAVSSSSAVLWKTGTGSLTAKSALTVSEMTGDTTMHATETDESKTGFANAVRGVQ